MESFRFPAPFPGLHAFDPTQTDLFFGRDAEVRQLIEKLRIQRLVGVVGISGIGKSSLIRAGLIPRLAQGYMADGGTRWRTVIVKPGNAPLTALARKLSDCFYLTESDVADVLGRSSRGLLRLAAEHLDAGENLFILVDQFEELMRFSAASVLQREMATEFVDLLLGATGHGPIERGDEKGPPIFIVLTMRSEFLGKCTRFPGLAEALNDGQFLVPRLERNQLKLAIEGPVAMVGGRISPALVQQLLNDAANEIDQLPLIQFALARIWDISDADRANGRALGLEHYEAVGSSIVKALNRAADAAVKALKQRDPRNGNIIRKLFQRLAEPGAADDEVRRPAPLSELEAVAECEDEEIKPLVEELARHGFLTISGDDDPEIDVTHESLIRRWATLNDWVKEEATSADVYRRLAGAAIRRGEPYRGRDLDEALKWRSQYRPTSAWAARYSVANRSFEDAMAFLELSRRRRWLFAGLLWAASCVLVAAGVGGSWSVWERYSMSTRVPLWLSTEPLDEADPKLHKVSGTFKECAKCPEMVVMPHPATFSMGESKKEDVKEVGSKKQENEREPHQVDFSKRFAVARYETTYEEWDICHELGGCRTNARTDSGRGRKPVAYVSWFDAQEYVKWLSKWTGKKYRLLSEAEWEYAARARSEENFWWGNEKTSYGQPMANCIDCYDKSNRQTTVVGSFPANPFGLHDMNGNVYEWVEDCYHGSYDPNFKFPPPTDGSAWIKGQGKEVDCNGRVVRGGSITEHAGNVRSGFRGFRNIGSSDMDSGIRVARDLSD